MEYQSIFWENIFLEVYKSTNHQRDNFINFLLFFILETILLNSEVIALLVTAYIIIYQQIFGHFLPLLCFSPDIQPIITFVAEIIATHSNSLKTQERAWCSHIRLIKNAKNFKKWPNFNKNWVVEANLGKLVWWLFWKCALKYCIY